MEKHAYLPKAFAGGNLDCSHVSSSHRSELDLETIQISKRSSMRRLEAEGGIRAGPMTTSHE